MSMAGLVTQEEVILNNLLLGANLHVRYEPKIFRTHGKKKMGFRPDFYIPSLELYIELGTLSGKGKRKKMRMMRGHFPSVKVLFIDNKELPALSAIPSGILPLALVSFHGATHDKGYDPEQRQSLLAKLAN